MFEILAEAVSRGRGIGPEGVGLGAAGVAVLGIITWLAKAGLTGNFRIGGGQSNKDAATDRAEAREDNRYNREACNLKHKEIEDHLLRNDLHAEKLEAKMDAGFSGVYNKLDRITDHLLDGKKDREG
jgi:hypothetical protein